MSGGDAKENYMDLLDIRRRFLNSDAIAQVATACASDSKKFGAWDQNLFTEWHAKYRWPGIMIYWRVDKSEVAAMMEGALRHCTEMSVDRNYVDTHGQSTRDRCDTPPPDASSCKLPSLGPTYAVSCTMPDRL